MSDRDKERIEEAYSTTYRSTIKRMICEADTDECREALHLIMNNEEIEWED